MTWDDIGHHDGQRALGVLTFTLIEVSQKDAHEGSVRTGAEHKGYAPAARAPARPKSVRLGRILDREDGRDVG